MAGAPERLAVIGGAPILPDDLIVNGLAGFAVPDDRSFALIGNAQPGDVAGAHARLRHDGPHRRNHCAPDFFRIVLNMTWRGINLRQFLLCRGKRSQRCVESNCPRGGGSLINGNKDGRQRFFPSYRLDESNDEMNWSSAFLSSAVAFNPILLRRQRTSSAFCAHSFSTR